MGLAAGLLGGHGGELGEPVHASGLFALQVLLRVEALDLGGKTGVEPLGVKGGDVIDARLSLDQRRPRGGGIQTQGANHPNAGYENAVILTHNPSRRWSLTPLANVDGEIGVRRAIGLASLTPPKFGGLSPLAG
jgi:hypothetical protein